MFTRRIIAAGIIAGVLLHITQSVAGYFIFDRFYLQNPDLVRDLGIWVGLYYLVINIVIGLAIACLSACLRDVWPLPGWQVGMRTACIIWAASSPVFIIKRQILLKLSNWLLLEILSDLIIYAVAGALAGTLAGRLHRDTRKGIT